MCAPPETKSSSPYPDNKKDQSPLLKRLVGGLAVTTVGLLIATIVLATNQGGCEGSNDNAKANKAGVSTTSEGTTTFDESLGGLPAMGSSPPVLGSNIDGGSVFANYAKARNDGQFFMLWEGITNYEKPSSSKVDVSVLFWCSNLQFIDIDTSTITGNGIGYTALCMQSYLKDFLSNANNAGGQNVHLPITTDEFIGTMSLSAVYMHQKNIFEGQYHKATDNYVVRFMDDGQSTMPILGWEVHDEGDVRPNSATSSWSGFGKGTWIPVDEAASLLGNDAEDFTPEKFTDIYAEVWYADPLHAGIIEIETIDNTDVKNAGDTTTFDESILNDLPEMGLTLPELGSNIDGGSVFSNYIKAQNDGQFFLLWEGITNYEKPSSSKVDVSVLFWCSDLEFIEIDNVNTGNGIGYTAHCLQAYFKDFLTNANNAGGQNVHLPITTDEFIGTTSLSAVYMHQKNIFEGQYHKATDNYVVRFMDDGQTSMPIIGWEVHDEGDTSPNAATSSWSGAGKHSWIPVGEAARLLNNNAEEFTPEKFSNIYKDVWFADPLHDDSNVEDTNPRDAAVDTALFDESSLPGVGSVHPVLGSNIDGGSAFANFVKARNDGQFFMLWEANLNYEAPSSSSIDIMAMQWCSGLEFTDIDDMNTSTGNGIGIGYTARCVQAYLVDTEALKLSAGAQLPHSITADEFVATKSLSAVYIPQTNTFEGQLHKTSDNYVVRFWDDGRPTTSALLWEVHDEGDTHSNSATSSLSGLGKLSWISVDDAASLLNNDANDFTPEKFADIYSEVWSSDPYHSATIDDAGTTRHLRGN